MTRLWTGKGDDGTSGLFFGGREPKTSARFAAVGAVDEAQAFVGLARAEARAAGGTDGLDEMLTAVARDLWVLNAELATADREPGQARGRRLVRHPRDGRRPGGDGHRRRRALRAADRVRRPRPGPGLRPCSTWPAPSCGAPSGRRPRSPPRARRRSRTSTGSPTLLWTLARWVEGAPLRSRDA